MCQNLYKFYDSTVKFCQADSGRFLFMKNSSVTAMQYHHQRLMMTLFPESASGNVQVCYRKEERRASFKSCTSPVFTQPFIELHFAFTSRDRSTTQIAPLLRICSIALIESVSIHCELNVANGNRNIRCASSYNKFMKLISYGKA